MAQPRVSQPGQPLIALRGRGFGVAEATEASPAVFSRVPIHPSSPRQAGGESRSDATWASWARLLARPAEQTSWAAAPAADTALQPLAAPALALCSSAAPAATVGLLDKRSEIPHPFRRGGVGVPRPTTLPLFSLFWPLARSARPARPQPYGPPPHDITARSPPPPPHRLLPQALLPSRVFFTPFIPCSTPAHPRGPRGPTSERQDCNICSGRGWRGGGVASPLAAGVAQAARRRSSARRR